MEVDTAHSRSHMMSTVKGHICIIQVMEKDRVFGEKGNWIIKTGTTIEKVQDFPLDSEIMHTNDIGTVNPLDDGGAYGIVQKLKENPSEVSIDSIDESIFPVKCVRNEDNWANWKNVGETTNPYSENRHLIPGDERRHDDGKLIPNDSRAPEDYDYTEDPEQSDSPEESNDGTNRYVNPQIDGRHLKAPGTVYSETDETDSEETGTSETRNPDYRRTNGEHVESPQDYPGTETGTSTQNIIEQDFTKAEWAALAAVDPEYLTDENISRLNEREMNYEEAVRATRKAVAANGWLDRSGDRLRALADLMQRAAEKDLEGPTGPGQGMKAANENFIVTAGTASPYPVDGCYDEKNYNPPEYGELDDSFLPASISGGDWDPEEYKCPSWMQGGENWYKGDKLKLNWTKIENVRGGTGIPDKAREENHKLSVVADRNTGFTWRSYCSNNAETIGINAENGLNSQEAAKCVQACWGAERTKQTPHNQDAQCGQLVRDFCEPFFDYDRETNTC